MIENYLNKFKNISKSISDKSSGVFLLCLNLISSFFSSSLSGFSVFLILTLVAIAPAKLSAQCNVATITTSTLTPICTDQVKSIGNGESINMEFINGEKYVFSFNANSSGADAICIDNVNKGAATFTYTAVSSGRLLVGARRNTAWTSNSAVITYKRVAPGDPTAFGNNEWKVYVWNAGDGLGGGGSWSTDYSGYYTIPSVLSFDTRTGQTNSTAQSWDPNGAPSSASGYTGCTVGSDNHSYSIKRQGFPCGNYSIKLINDDRSELYIDGALVNTQAGWNSAYTGVVWTGDLGASTTIEFKISEAGGGSNAGLEFTNLSTQATTFVPSSIAATTMTLGWTRGNGASGVLVVAKAGSAPTDPTTGVAYTGNAAYGSGTAVGGGYAVYSGTGTSVNLTGLLAGTTYYFAAYEYNASSCYTNGMVELTGNATTTTPYKATFTSMSTGSANWCAGEVREVTVTVTNAGSATWTDAAPDVNIGCKWNYMADYDYRVDAGGLAPAASRTYTFTVTAPGASSENLRFDVVKEGDCWFANNNGSCGSGNSYSTSSAITISAAPPTPAPITASTTTVTCGSTLALASAAPTGGTISTAGGYRIHTFNSSGTFTTPTGFTPGTVEVLVVGGGGGGGSNGGGGGGGGGVTSNSSYAVTAATAYPVTVGTGGITGNNVSGGAPGLQGNNSVFGTITSYGGGGGANRDYGGAATAGRGAGAGGGGGGGGAAPQSTAGAGNGTGGAGGAGYDGGCNSAGGGGGGANSSAGTAGTVGGGGGTAGNGGTGVSSAISGTTKYYGAGGGGGTTNFTGCGGGSPWVNGTGGSSVGGNGEGTAAVANSGSGAGAEAAGAAGVVIIRYPDVSAGTWTSSNTGVATVNPVNGVVTGVTGGSATISYSYTNPGGCASAAATYVVTVPGVPTAVTASASPNPVCTGSTLTLTGGATHATSWGWTGPNTYTSTSQSPTVSTNVTAAMAGTYALTATNACGSAAPVNTAAVAVTTLPAATISYAGSPFCISVGAGQAVTRTGTAGGTYSSTAGLTIDGTTGAINPSTSTAGVYTVTYTIAAASGCAQVTATTSVTIKALPAITGQPASPAAINAGAGTAVFTVTATGGSITYQWEADDGGWHSIANGAIYSGVTTASLSVINPPGTYNGRKFRCVVSGCAPDATSDGAATLTVITLGNENPCYGTVQNYNVTNVAGVTYTWTYPSGWSVVSGQGTNSINLNVGISSGNVSVTPSTCGGNGTARTLAVTVASVSIAASDAEICSGESVTFTATPVNGGTPTYQWTKNGSDIPGETASTYVTTTLANTDAIAVKMTSTAGCLITSSPINMVVNPASLTASVTISASETNICSGVSVTFTAVPVNGGVTPSYQWKVDGGNVGSNSSTYTSTTLANNNSVTVVMTNNDACILGSPATSNAIVMTVNTSLTASVSIAEDVNNICSGTSVTLTATPTNGGTPTYQWKNGAANVGTNSNTYTSTTLANNDAITVVMTTSLLCTTPSPVTSNIVTMVVNTPIVNNTVSAAQVICTGSTPAALTGTVPTGGNGAYTYLWEESTTSSTAGFASAAGTNTNAGYSPGALTATTWYRRTAISAPCASNVSDAIKITVNTAIVNNTVSFAQSICSGTTPNPIAGSVPTGGNGVYTYVWALSTTSSTAGFGGSIATTQDFSPGALTDTTWYRRTVSSAPCASSVSDAIRIFINPDQAASVSIAASATSICNGTSVVFTPTPTNGGTAPTYQWTKNGTNISGETFNTYTTSTLANNDSVRVVMTSNASPCLTGSPATSAAIRMIVNAIPVATATNSAQTKCSGVALTTMVLGTSNSVAGTTFAWTRDNGDVASGIVTGIAASGTGNIAGTLTNTTTSAVTVTFTITPTGPANTNCAGSPITATVLVNPGTPAVPGTISGIANTYAGFTEPYSIAAVSSATSYTWAVPTGWTIASGQGTTSIRATAGTAGQNGDITVTATNGCGTSTASTYPVTVTANTAAPTSVCEGTTQTYTTQYREGVTYAWSVPADWTIVSGAGTNSIRATVGATSGNVTVSVSNSCGNGTDRTLAITADSLPVMTSTSSTATCSGVAINIALTATPASTFSWEAYDRATTTGESDSPQTTSTINDVITTTATTIDTVIYSVTPTSTAGCVGGGTVGSLDPQLITVRVNPSNHWTGAAGDRKWRTAGNWCVVPTCTSDAFIPTSPTGGNYPQVEFPDAICRDLTISTGASLELLSDNIALCGNWLNNGTFTPATYKVTFQGTADQTIGGSVASNTFYDLQISNSGASGSDNVTLNKPATVTNVLNLSNGILVTTSTNLLTLTNSANTATNGGGTGTYVSGPMRWNGINGAGPFIFPTGKGSTKWARIGIKDLTAATDFTAEYFNTSYANVGPSFMATTPTPVLTNVSGVEYWNFDRVSGTGNGKVSLYWENATWSGITDCAEDGALQIAHWDSGISKWENNNNDDDIGAGSTCGGATAGYITTTAVVTEFSPFTFGSDDPLVNPLPVELLYFKANYNGKTVDVKWETASEINNDYFTVERSIDGVNFITVGVIIPSQAKGGNSTSVLSYGIIDENVSPGVYYYRLKQTDFNGEYKYSNMDVVEIKGSADFSFNISPNPSDGTELNSIITAEKDQEIVIAVYDVLGQEIYSKIIVTEQKGNTMYAIDLLQKLSSGVYMITATSNQKVYTKRLVVN